MPDDSFDESKLVLTRDGSHTVYSSQFDQHYHNPNGAVAESRYVFFEQTNLLDALQASDDLTIFEAGFGTGLNLMLLLDYYRRLNSRGRVTYYSVEGFPIGAEVAAHLNYQQYLDQPEVSGQVISLFSDLQAGMNQFKLGQNISVFLFNGMFDDFPTKNIEAEYVFHDAFSPAVNPDLWTGTVFEKIRSFCADQAILSTYCAASKARGALAWAGWNVARAKGALGKREMTLAALKPDRLGDRKRVNEERLARRYEQGDFN